MTEFGETMMPRLSNSHPYIRRISFLLTQRCPIRCRHCVYRLGPSTNQDTDVVAKELLDWMEQAVEAGITEFCFTGGEPFLVYGTLQRAASKVAHLRAKAGVITNAFWAVSEEAARRKLEPLCALQELSISADHFHQEHVPFERVRHAIVAARTVGIPPRVKVAYTDDNEVTILQNSLADVLAPDEMDADMLRNVGRMVKQETLAPPLPREALESGCQATTRAPTVLPDGSVCGCCGPILTLKGDHPMWLGNLREKSLSQILRDVEFNVVYQLIRIRGPYALYQLIADELDRPSFDMSSPCGLCYSLLSNRQSSTLLTAKAHDLSLFRDVAVERLLIFNEPVMLASLQWGENAMANSLVGTGN